MKLFRQIAVTTLVTVAIFSTVTYTACTKTDSTAANAAFVGTYAATEGCTPPLAGTGWTSTITASSIASDQIVISNFGASGSTINATVTNTGSGTGTIVLTTTTISGNVVSGGGSLSGTTITITYNLVPSGGGTSYSCTQTMLKQ